MKINVLLGGYTTARYQTLYKPCIYIVLTILAIIVISFNSSLLVSVLFTYPQLVANVKQVS